jgi:hypothetical protein
MTKQKRIELFDKYFPAAMTGVLSNVEIVRTTCLTRSDEKVQIALVEAAASYAYLMTEVRENVVKNTITKNAKNKL